MNFPSCRIPLLVLAILAVLSLPAGAARQVVALFPPEVLPAGGDNVLLPAVPILEKAIKEKLGERFDVVSPVQPIQANTEEVRRGKARALGASYIVGGTLSRIGKGVTLDVTLAPVEDSGSGRTVVVSNRLEDDPAGSERYVSLFRGLGSEAARRVNDLFFGSGGQGGNVPRFAGTISRSSAIPGEVVSVAMSDLDRDGKMELAAAYDTGIVIYRLEGDDLREEARIPEAGPGLFHLDARDIDRDGVAEILTVRFAGGSVLSDIWRYDEKEGYRRVAADLPYLLRTADLGAEGIVLLGQEADPARIYRGPIHRMAFDLSGKVSVRNGDVALPLPEGTFLLAFAPLRWKDEIRFAVLSSRDRIVYIDSAGKELWEGLDAFTGTDVALPAQRGKLRLPVRMLAVDTNRDGFDEAVLMNVLVSAGVFFESLRVATQAELVCFSQMGDSLQLAWRSPHTGASAQDLLLDRRRNEAPRFGMASRDREKILGGATQWRVVWMR